MIQIAIIVALFVFLFFTKKIWGAWLVKFFKKRDNKKEIETAIDTIFRPTGVVRTFTIAINLEEDIGGAVKITISKVKEKEKDV